MVDLTVWYSVLYLLNDGTLYEITVPAINEVQALKLARKAFYETYPFSNFQSVTIRTETFKLKLLTKSLRTAMKIAGKFWERIEANL
jgi:hypothetical protein